MNRFNRHHFATLCFALAIALSVLVLIGWTFDILILKTFLSDRPDMKANAAICFLMLALGIFLSQARFKKDLRRIGHAFTLMTFIFASVVLFEYIFQITFFIDEFFFTDVIGAQGHSPPGRYSSVTSFNFILLSAATLINCAPNWRWEKTAQSMAMLVFLTSLISFLGNVLGMPQLFGMGVFMPMAIHTGFIFILLSAAYLATRLDTGLMRLFSVNTLSAVMARQMLVASIAVPLLIRIVTALAETRGLFSEDVGVFIRVMGGQIFMTTIVLGSAAAFWRGEQESAKLRESEKRNANQLKLITDAQPSLVSYIDRDLKYQVVNQGYTDWFGHEKNFFIGKTIYEALGPSKNNVGQAEIEAVLKGETVKFNNEFTLPSGKLIKTQTTFVPDRDEKNLVRGFVVVTHDITESSRVQEYLQAAKKAAEEASLAKSQFLANMSHEIRTPLGVILGFSDLALENLHKPDDVKEFLLTVQRNAKELSNLIGDILDLSKVEANKLDIEDVEFNLPELLDEVAASLSGVAAEKGLHLTVARHELVPLRIKSDRTRIRQILVNLIGNAVKFTPSGRVELSVSSTEIRERVQLIFRVQDTGIGISKQQQERLFKPFSQADSSMTRKFGGTGLGLMLSKQLAQALGGDLTLISSEAGKGSTFEARLPVTGVDARVSEKNAVRLKPKADLDLQNLRVLLVEDVEENRWLVQEYLNSTGVALTMAENGAEALTAVANEAFDIILMDIQMPIVDGYTATATLRQQGFTRPIVALTAHAIQEERDRALSSGFTAYLTKPLFKDALFQTLQDLKENAQLAQI